MVPRWPVATFRRFWGLVPSARLGWCHDGRLAARQPLAVGHQGPQRSSHPPQLAVRAMAGAAGSSTKAKQVYKCSSCGEESLQWTGSCRSCKEFNTMERVNLIQLEPESSKGGGGGGARAAARFAAGRQAGLDGGAPAAARQAAQSVFSGGPARRGWVADAEGPQRLSDVTKRSFRHSRLQLPGDNGRELARVLGGGVVPGSLTLIGGDPGVGKSTLLLQMASMLTQASSGALQPAGSSGSGGLHQGSGGSGEAEEGDGPVLYVSGEESAEQIGGRAERMGIGGNTRIFVYSTNRLEHILDEMIRLQPKAVIVDSINTVYLENVTSAAGGVTQVKECATALMQVGKRERVPVFLVGHVTKQGDLAGPRVLEHLVDTVVQMEGGRQSPVRLVRCLKNRYGNTDEVGVFSMHEEGLRVVPDPSQLFLSSRSDSSGAGVSSAVTVLLEGSRPLLVEVQALCSTLPEGAAVAPGRINNGLDWKRLQLILGVLNKHTQLRPYAADVYVNVLGGYSMEEPSSDLAVAVAIGSSYYNQPVARDMAIIGEIGLGGEVRTVAQVERRVVEAAKLGFRQFLVPPGSGVGTKGKLAGLAVTECRRVTDAFSAALGTGGRSAQPNRLVVRAEGSGFGGLFGKGGGDKQDAARKALQDAFKGKKDPFAAAEAKAKQRGGGGGGGGGKGGGGGGGSGGGFNFQEWGDSFRRGLRSAWKTVGAVLLFGAALFVMTLWRPLLSLAVKALRYVLRLDGNPRVQQAASKQLPQLDLSKTEGLGNVEESIISKYGAAGAAGDAGSEEEEEEEDED
ncbi:hypothetical protein N2152v2_005324 [Parachlorella kessleri]